MHGNNCDGNLRPLKHTRPDNPRTALQVALMSTASCNEDLRHMLWFKAFHIVFVVTWFAGLFYLPRLFVYHADAADAVSNERFKVMERRLFIMMTIGGALSVVFGVCVVLLAPSFMQAHWLHAKLTLVVLLILYHLWCQRLMAAFRADANRHSARWFRMFNEVPSLLLIAIVILVVVKPF
jgi:putative membrane protein